ncbi:hypothetical protein [Chelativorans sp. Marseille-P2723]|uniref:hypothetical protein n=1 Tax=Chelativorans sp. Marseille-P2723 TaxID=2709133 RepID=UPI00156EDDA9|nr:hypothetical protein [Chelativorans sp. Marseille-P2723]
MAQHTFLVAAIMFFSILIGAAGFMLFEGRALEDAVIHSAYILSGFGLVEMPDSFAGKLFAGLYGLYASLFFLAAFSIIFAPIVHRILHRLHLDVDETAD